MVFKCMFKTAIHSWFVFPLMSIKCASYFLIHFVLQIIYLEIIIAMPACFLVSLAWNIPLYPFTLSWSLLMMMCIS